MEKEFFCFLLNNIGVLLIPLLQRVNLYLHNPGIILLKPGGQQWHPIRSGHRFQKLFPIQPHLLPFQIRSAAFLDESPRLN